MTTFGLQWTPARAVLVIILITSGLYLGSFSVPFFWDDDVLIVNNPHIRSLENPNRFWAKPFWELVSAEHKERDKPNRHIMYRPLVMFSFALDYWLYGLWAPGFHLTNLLFHLAVLLLAFALARKIVGGDDCELAALAILLFAVHPVMTQAVTWIAGRSDLLCALFVLGGIYLFHLCEERKSYGLAVLLAMPCFFLALLTKEVAILFPFLLMATYRDPLANKKRIVSLILLCPIPLAAYSYLKRAASSGSPLWDSGEALWSHLSALLKGTTAIFRYLYTLLVPTGLRLSYQELSQKNLELFPWDWFFFPFLAALLFFCLWQWRKRHALAFVPFWFVLPLLPITNGVLFKGLWTQFAERYLYLPSIFFFLLPLGLISKFLEKHPQWRGKVGRALLLFVLLLGLLTMQRNGLLQDPVALWQAELKASPNNVEALSNLAINLCRQGKAEKGIVHLRKLCLLTPNSPLAWNNRLLAAVDCEFLDEAKLSYERARRLAPKQTLPSVNYALLLLRKGNYVKARGKLAEALRIQSNNRQALLLLAHCYLGEKRPKEAKGVLLKILSLWPKDPEARELLTAAEASLTQKAG